ncbi:hypothetical protein I6F35_11830 [Bradyrhizobium sp. BRP22]|uniref:hypothetical protein n=1 Tax=Bradyrhizobium sp. BRP22 TaxID=2793821 RepID=UPI001CD58E47|nr:hypothetical protein [Bradyrhizobium sp. BRP22]MCA1453902.1 hypothetical protein [Bradyrhizobium sp. BRP22]
MKNELDTIDRTLDEMLVNLGTIVLKLAAVSKTAAERRALAQSVHQYTVCAERSSDPRVQRLRAELEATLQPPVRLVSSR